MTDVRFRSSGVNMVRSKWKKAGFTLVELLIVVAITGILASFVFVAVLRYQRQFRLKEANSIAQEIYEGAQNHLTAAQASGVWDQTYSRYLAEDGSIKDEEAFRTYFGEPFNPAQANDYEPAVNPEYQHNYRTFSVRAVNSRNQLAKTALSMLLPIGAIDETVRSGKSYVIEYDAYTAQIYGVFYSEDPDFDLEDVNRIDAMTGGRTSDDNRIQYKDGDKKYAVGYYGGATNLKKDASDSTKAELVKPEVQLINGERLVLKVVYTDNSSLFEKSASAGNREFKLKLKMYDVSRPAYNAELTEYVSQTVKIQGTGSGSYKVITRYYVLDSIVDQNKHLAVNYPSLAGKNIAVKATVSYGGVTSKQSKSAVSNVANSLFADDTRLDSGGVDTASITNARHLANLSEDFNGNTKITRAVIQNDITWYDGKKKDFFAAIEAENSAYGINEPTDAVYFPDGKKGDDFTFYGIRSDYLTSVLANGKTLSHFKIDSYSEGQAQQSAGLFASLNSKEAVISGLNLNEIQIAGGKTDAAALIGTSGKNLEALSLVDVTVNHLQVKESKNTGGLIGRIERQGRQMEKLSLSNVTVTDLKVEGKEQAGGMIGRLGGLKSLAVKNSSVRSGDGAIGGNDSAASGTSVYGAISSDGAAAGGLLAYGDGISEAEIKDCFVSVRTVENQTGVAGGLIGTLNGSNVKIENCYVGGRTTGGAYAGSSARTVYSKQGQFAGGFAGQLNLIGTSAVSDCYSTASVTADTNDVANIGGFGGSVSVSGTGVTGCYATGKVTMTHNVANANVGAFAGTISRAAGSYALSGINNGMRAVGNTDKPDGVGFAAYDSEKLTGNAPAKPVDPVLPDIYPFRTVTGGMHYGDWPTKFESDDFTLVYYEVVNGKYYYHGFTLNLEGTEPQEIRSQEDFISGNSPASENTYVTEAGYALIVGNPKQYSADQISLRLGADNRLSRLSAHSSLKDGLAERLGLSGQSYILNPSYFTYVEEDNDQTRAKSFRVAVSSGGKNTKSILINPIFAKCIGTSIDQMPSVDAYEIRTADQLQTLLTAANAVNYLNNGWTNGDYQVYQTMDLDLSGTIIRSAVELYHPYRGIAPEGYVRRIVNLKAPLFTGVNHTSQLQGELTDLLFENPKTSSIISGNNTGVIRNITVSGTAAFTNANRKNASAALTGNGLLGGDAGGTIQAVTIRNAAIDGNGIAGNTSVGGNISNISIEGSDIKGSGLAGENAYQVKIEDVTIRGTRIGGNGISSENAVASEISRVTLSDSTIAGNGITGNTKDQGLITGITLAGGSVGKNGICQEVGNSASVSDIHIDSAEITGNGIAGNMLYGSKITGVQITGTSSKTVIHGNGICDKNDAYQVGGISDLMISNTRIDGNGVSASNGEQAKYRSISFQNVTISKNGLTEIGTTAQNVSVSEFHVDGSTIAQNGVTTDIGSGNTLENIRFRDTLIRQDGLFLKTNGANPSAVRHVSMNDVRIEGNGIAGSLYNLTLQDVEMTNMSIAKNGVADVVDSSTLYKVRIVNAWIGRYGLYSNISSGMTRTMNRVIDNHVYGDLGTYAGSATHHYFRVNQDAQGNLTDPNGAYSLVQIGNNIFDGDSPVNAAGLFGALLNDTVQGNSVTGMVTGKTTAAGFVYRSENSTLSDNYANTIVTLKVAAESDTASGFATALNKDTLVRCVSMGVVQTTDSGRGTVNGFANEMKKVGSSGSVQNSYSAVWSLLGKTVYRFTNTRADSLAALKDCLYLAQQDESDGALAGFASLAAELQEKLSAKDYSYGAAVTSADAHPYYVYLNRPEGGEEIPYPVPYRYQMDDQGRITVQSDSANAPVAQAFYGDFYLPGRMKGEETASVQEESVRMAAAFSSSLNSAQDDPAKSENPPAPVPTGGAASGEEQIDVTENPEPSQTEGGTGSLKKAVGDNETES